MKKIILLLLILLFSSLAFSANSHCWRQDISRTVSPSVSGTGLIPSDDPNFDYIFNIGGGITFSGFGSYNYACDDGASGNTKNYFDLFDNADQKIIYTNSNTPTSGPSASTSAGMCMINQTICYVENGVYKPLPQGQCDVGSYSIGAGVFDNFSVSLSPDYVGEHEWSLRLGAISPAVGSPYDPKINLVEKKRVKFVVTSPEAVLVFAPQPVQKINSFSETGTTQKEVFFTVLSESYSNIRINNYSVRCPQGVTCSLQQSSGGKPVYSGFVLAPNQAMIIPVNISFDNSSIPKKFSVILDLNYGAVGLGMPKMSTSAPVSIESGLLDKQDFQVLVSNQSEQKYCIAADGTQGYTGEAVAPRVNLYFGGNKDPSAAQVGNLISINECSPIDYNTGAANPNWVYCSQKEFLVQLGERLGEYQLNTIQINNYEQNLQPELSAPLRQKNGALLGFEAYVRAQDIDSVSVDDSVEAISNTLFQKLGLQSTVYESSLRGFKNLINSIEFVKTVNGIEVEGSEIAPGKYRINVDLNELYEITASDAFLFESDNTTPTPALDIKVRMELLQEPSFNWFFYSDKDTDSFNTLFANTGNPSKYQMNVVSRGDVLYFNEDTPETARMYEEFAFPVLLRITDSGSMDSTFEVEGFGEEDIFTYWTGIASTLGNGCETTSITAVEKQLPYRVPDSNVSNATSPYDVYEIAELRSVQTGSVMYLETVLYLPTVGSVAGGGSSVILHSASKMYSKNENPQGSGPYTLQIAKTGTEFVVQTTTETDALASIFEKIKEESICVTNSSGTGINEWKLFWNQQKVIDSMQAKKTAVITDATRCAARQNLSS